MGDVVLQLSDLHKHYHQAGVDLHILRGASLTMHRGDRVALIGPSGCGKTTLLQLAGLLDSPDSGQVMIGNEDMSRAGDEVRTRVRREQLGFVYQFHHLLPEFSAAENIAIPQMLAGISRKAAHKKASALLAELGLADRSTHRPAELSGGEQQRVAIARALANDPLVLLADEPTGNLDPETAAHVMHSLEKALIATGSALLMVTHNRALAGDMQQVVTLEKGAVVSSE